MFVCMHSYVNIILHEYVRTILGTRPDAHFLLDPLATPSSPLYGNAVSIEFNFIYRWHMGIGQEDTEWLDSVMRLLGPQMAKEHASKGTQGTVNKLGTDQDAFEALLPAFNDAFVQASAQELELGLPIAGAHRNWNTGEFSDFDITRCLRRGFTQVASQLGNGLNTPAALEQVEIAGIIQGRKAKTCTLNDMRRHLNLTPLTSFEDFSEKPEVQQALKDLYGSPDNVELYTGLMVERTKVTGLQLPYTMGRAILSNAVNLLRNDRIVSQELIPANMTNWGYQYYKGNEKEQGRVLPTMLRTLLPEANANGHPAFSEEEMNTLFNVPQSVQPRSAKDTKKKNT